MSRKKLILDPNLLLSSAVMLLAVPFRWYAAWILASLTHEVFHCIGILLCGSRICSIRICATGAKITTDLSNTAHEIFCLLAGPVGALTLLSLSASFPQVALCALVQSAYNLLPLPELDGGRVMKRTLDLFLAPNVADAICSSTRKVTVLAITALCLLGSLVWRLGIIPLILAGIFLQRHGKLKIPCKPRFQAVQ